MANYRHYRGVKLHEATCRQQRKLRPVELCHNTRDLMAQFYLKFRLITQHEVPFINTSEATKKVEWPNRERQNVTNLERTVEVV